MGVCRARTCVFSHDLNIPLCVDTSFAAMDLGAIFRSTWMGVLYAAVDKSCTTTTTETPCSDALPIVDMDVWSPSALARAVDDEDAKAVAWCLRPDKCQGADVIVVSPVCRFVRTAGGGSPWKTLVVDVVAVRDLANAFITASPVDSCSSLPHLKVDWITVQVYPQHCGKCDTFRCSHDVNHYDGTVRLVACPVAPPCACASACACDEGGSGGGTSHRMPTHTHATSDTCALCTPYCLDTALAGTLQRCKLSDMTGLAVFIDEMRHGEDVYVEATHAQKAALLAWWRFFDTLRTLEWSFCGYKNDTPFYVFVDPCDPTQRHLFHGTDYGAYVETFLGDIAFRLQPESRANYSQCAGLRGEYDARKSEGAGAGAGASVDNVLDMHCNEVAVSALAHMPWLVKHTCASAGFP